LEFSLKEFENDISRFRALSDTSSVVAHDLCAQLHVMQFCLAEIEEHVSEEGREYLKRMGTSTSYISRLVESFRRGLKVAINDHGSFPIDEIYEGAIELIKNHYFVVLERTTFTVTGNLGSLKIKNNGRKLLQMIFTLYSFFMDEVKSSDEEELFTFSINFQGIIENSRFVRITLETKGRSFSESWLSEKLKEKMAEKGKLRQFLGMTLIQEELAMKPDFFSFKTNQDGNTLSFVVPLEFN
jgi:hypothetical protein